MEACYMSRGPTRPIQLYPRYEEQSGIKKKANSPNAQAVVKMRLSPSAALKAIQRPLVSARSEVKTKAARQREKRKNKASHERQMRSQYKQRRTVCTRSRGKKQRLSAIMEGKASPAGEGQNEACQVKVKVF
ncbi:hypothetical protein P280DRAFT_154022 [Massarina eburnea CBS 473.64]|uniref:Uncharacterized protein n=1 Tax=Massarina eburnea CBS 473.64 TaxID=1395130 RepID=A0A6A6RPZ1_9PLEO|nr:hypothetical protein P280DRAFT_154022 [Massarina eburnea CBS 473.64]